MTKAALYHLNNKRRAEGQFFVQMQEELFHGRIAFNEAPFGDVHHLFKLFGPLLLGVVGGDEVVEHDQEEEEDAHQVGEHGQLDVGDHVAGAKEANSLKQITGENLMTWNRSTLLSACKRRGSSFRHLK